LIQSHIDLVSNPLLEMVTSVTYHAISSQVKNRIKRHTVNAVFKLESRNPVCVRCVPLGLNFRDYAGVHEPHLK